MTVHIHAYIHMSVHVSPAYVWAGECAVIYIRTRVNTYVCAPRRMAREAAQARPKQIFTFNCETRQFNKLIKYLIL